MARQSFFSLCAMPFFLRLQVQLQCFAAKKGCRRHVFPPSAVRPKSLFPQHCCRASRSRLLLGTRGVRPSERGSSFICMIDLCFSINIICLRSVAWAGRPKLIVFQTFTASIILGRECLLSGFIWFVRAIIIPSRKNHQSPS